MAEIKYQTEINGTIVDAKLGSSIFEYKARINDLRGVQSSLMMLGRVIADLPGNKGIIILDETKISAERLSLEWKHLKKLFTPSLLSRLSMVVFSTGTPVMEYGSISDEEMKAAIKIQKKLGKTYEMKPNRESSAFFEVLRVLLISWFRGEGSLKLTELSERTGYSYPPVAATLEKIGPAVMRHTDRSVELKYFPKDAWFMLLAASNEIRKPKGFTARRPRPIKYFIDKIVARHDENVGFGGLIGARHYMPGIDLIGTPRLDLSVTNWKAEQIERFVYELDPGLAEVKAGEIPQIMIHHLYRPNSLFDKKGGMFIADQVECLLDLQEARLESQALELLDYLKII